MKAYGGVDIEIHIFLTSALAGGEWSASRPVRFTLRERAPGIHWIGGRVDPKAGLHDVEKRKFLTLLGLELRPLGRPVVASPYSDYAIPAANWTNVLHVINAPCLKYDYVHPQRHQTNSTTLAR
jgi:hypothetical protein